MGRSELIIYDENLRVKESITWKIQQKSLTLHLRDAKGNPVARANVPFDTMKKFILENNKMK